MSNLSSTERNRAQESRAAIERLYVAMRHLFMRGGYKPLGVSGEALVDALLTLRPEIYGSIADNERVELDGLLYIFDRLPRGIEECRLIRLIAREGFENSGFEVLIPPRRKRNCYRIDEENMYIEMTRGRSDIYDILTHLTFLYMESRKIMRNSQDHKHRKKREWLKLEEYVLNGENTENSDASEELALANLSTVLGRTFQETRAMAQKFEQSKNCNSLFHVTYWLGKLAMDEIQKNLDREITVSSSLREIIGHHVYGEQWARNIKSVLKELGLIHRPIHIISSNPHSVMNTLYGKAALKYKGTLEEMALVLSQDEGRNERKQVEQYARAHGMVQLEDESGTNIVMQIFDTALLDLHQLPNEITVQEDLIDASAPVLLVMDYAFGEQAYETIDELLKPFEWGNEKIHLNVVSINIMGKAGILDGFKGDIMVPDAHIFEGTADNYPIVNDLDPKVFEGRGLQVRSGTMITVLGTSLQNKDILQWFLQSSWKAIGLEMEGAHYQKAIQSSSQIRNHIRKDVKLRYAYYASDNPLITGHTLASGALGADGVKPTYLITQEILKKIFTS